jgi:hypothetical protein
MRARHINEEKPDAIGLFQLVEMRRLELLTPYMRIIEELVVSTKRDDLERAATLSGGLFRTATGGIYGGRVFGSAPDATPACLSVARAPILRVYEC